MVREIVQISVGQCGIQIGNNFVNAILMEHNLNKNGEYMDKSILNNSNKLNKLNVYFDEIDDNNTMKFIPRACLIDLEASTVDIIKSCSIASIYKPDYVCIIYHIIIPILSINHFYA